MNALEEGLEWLKNATTEDIEKLDEELKEYTTYGPRLLTEEEYKEMEDTLINTLINPTYEVGEIITQYDHEYECYRIYGPITHVELVDNEWVYFFINKKTGEENCLTDYQLLTM